ncbi:hypothetical protein CU669_18075 [Paramagnetospirillum kuznetsovii]|uniref:3-hydroxyacyl-CoA dehydrogenase n=1 Tax=Paramagnetospirillum kuznetsovii TaxID=2053833 RepID=A0A364NTZ1_9PROT|nr:3-hydroxyacyl-CoA dehydrogenase [Paramagnetospirillum kuznetsovii]RAU20548.1 hypothetical protein CU669_18075 [Paramagnetospirillum kuznetsovii]
MTIDIRSIAIIGGGTMGSGIAAAAAAQGRRVTILEADEAAAAKARERTLAAAKDEAEREIIAARLDARPLDQGDVAVAEADWVCEAIIEDLEAKRALFRRLEPLRKPGSVVSTNTSGIPLAAISADFPESFRRNLVVTHFFNPVRVMRLLEIVPGIDTDPAVVGRLVGFCRDTLGKGVVHAKDTVNFIANRIGCFWMLSGLHKAKPYLARGLTPEEIDALMGTPVGLPSTGLYGLIDLIGLDVMDFVGRNLADNLPPGDVGLSYTAFPDEELNMLRRGQLGRKSGGGFYRVVKLADGSKRKETFDLTTEAWRAWMSPAPQPSATDAAVLLFAKDEAGRFAWDLLGETLLYAADLVPEIADDPINVDRAMRWGFNWRRGPFELLDHIGPARVIDRLEASGRPLPRMLAVLKASGGPRFYRDGRTLGADGAYHPIPAE